MIESVNLREVDFPTLPLDRLRPNIGEERLRALTDGASRAAALMSGRTLWQVNSTATGGGVAEMLQVLLGYTRSADVDARWCVIEGDPLFFDITKRVHNRIHGAAGDDGSLGDAERAHYDRILQANASSMCERISVGDVVILHDPQTAGLVEPLTDAGARVLWRSHIGSDTTNEHTEEAWAFLRPHVEGAERLVFSRDSYVPDWLDSSRAVVIPPSIDPASPKNQDLAPEVVHAILRRAGLFDGGGGGDTSFVRRDGSPGRVRSRAAVVGGALDPDLPLVLQVSRWDRLKDMQGVMEGFVGGVAGRARGVAVLAGPEVAGVTDDPEGLEVYESCKSAWEALAPEDRQHVRLVTLPMEDVDENAAIVNALQRHAEVVVQKSLAEGFGLTVSEGMWKGHPVVGSAVGGIPDQIAPGTGVLLDDPGDLGAFADAVATLLADRESAARMGAAAREHVRAHFVGDAHLLRYVALLEDLLRT